MLLPSEWRSSQPYGGSYGGSYGAQLRFTSPTHQDVTQDDVWNCKSMRDTETIFTLLLSDLLIQPCLSMNRQHNHLKRLVFWVKTTELTLTPPINAWMHQNWPPGTDSGGVTVKKERIGCLLQMVITISLKYTPQEQMMRRSICLNKGMFGVRLENISE